MNIADLSIKRPVFMTAIVVVLLTLGFMGLKKLPVDLFPNVTFPIVSVQTIYPGAGPEEVETLISKVLEEEVSTVPGIKSIRSINVEGGSTVVVEFVLSTDIKYAEQQVRDKVSTARNKLPDDLLEDPVIRRIDPADQPIMVLSLQADVDEAKLYDIADDIVKPKIEQADQVGLVQIYGGRKREIHVELDRKKMLQYEVSADQVVRSIKAYGQNIPAGKVESPTTETVFRTLGEFKSVKDIGDAIVSFLGNDVSVTLSNIGKVKDTVEDEKSKAFTNGKQSLFLFVFRQTGSNTIAVADGVKKRLPDINKMIEQSGVKGSLSVVRDGSKPINDNVYDVKESIFIGILLTIVVVFFFLGSARSTFITGLALPNSLIGAFFLMNLAGFSINVMSLLALSLAVGLLIDDAIVVRENIYRHTEMGEPPIVAASKGTKEVTLAVIATTLAVIAVFGPIGFLDGVVGQFFKEFGLTVCFALVISLFDALTMAPMLSAYFAGKHEDPSKSKGWYGATFGRVLGWFNRFQDWLEDIYEHTLRWSIRHPVIVIGTAFLLFVVSLGLAKFIPKTFLPAQDQGEFSVSLEMPPGTSLQAMSDVSLKVDSKLRANPEVKTTVLIVGSGGAVAESNKTTFFVNMVPSKERKINTSDFKAKVREQLKEFAFATPIVKDIDNVGGGMRPFMLNISGDNLEELQKVSQQVYEKLKTHPGLTDVDLNFRSGKPEFQVQPIRNKMESLGISTSVMGSELRTQMDGTKAAVFREKGNEYDVRVRLQEDQRDLIAGFNQTYIPNVNMRLIRLSTVANGVKTEGPSTINRQDRSRYYQIAADVAPDGPGMGGVIEDVNKMFASDIPLPAGMGYKFIGQAENFKELMMNMMIAAGLGTLFVYLVLASLYESFVTPFTIMLVLPLAACGAFYALLISGESLNIFSMIGCIMLLGVATKNSILLVDYTKQLVEGGMEETKAIIQAGRTRLRPILMTTFALIAGMLPIAIGLNEASKQRTSMGVAIIGGLISSTLLTLVVVPAAYRYIERFRVWSLGKVNRLVGNKTSQEHVNQHFEGEKYLN